MRVKYFKLFFLKSEGGVEPLNKTGFDDFVFNLNTNKIKKPN